MYKYTIPTRNSSKQKVPPHQPHQIVRSKHLQYAHYCWTWHYRHFTAFEPSSINSRLRGLRLPHPIASFYKRVRLSSILICSNLQTLMEKKMAVGEEVSPLLPKQEEQEKGNEKSANKVEDFATLQRAEKETAGWTVDGLPLGHGNVMGAPVARSQWNSRLFACLGRNDEFCSSDLEVCLLGTVAPCVLYGSNVERLSSAPGTFANHCLPYTSLYLLGNLLFGWNYLAPWISHPSRTTIRRKFNLEGSCEAFSRSCGCCRGIMEDDEQRERCESSCDFATHFCCHRCALCQEGRELRRRLPYPGFNGRSVLVMLPPMEQMMGREP